jgi:hypothetical protein
MAVDYIAGLKCSDRANDSPLDAAICTAALRKPDRNRQQQTGLCIALAKGAKWKSRVRVKAEIIRHK